MTTRSQKRKAAEELISTEIETSLPENTPSVNPVAGTSKSPKITSDNLEEIKSSLRKEIMSDLTKILAENQKEMLKLIAPTTKKQHAIRSAEESDSDPDDIPENATSTPIRNKTTATASKTTPINSRNTSQCRKTQKKNLKLAKVFLQVDNIHKSEGAHLTKQNFFGKRLTLPKNVGLFHIF